MPGPSRETILRLYRDALSTPWGFRLQGGKDVKQPLAVQKVNVGSPVDGELFRGDVILEIQNCDATTMTHQKAQEMIKNSGGSLLLRVRRSGYHDPQPGPPPAGLSIPPGQQQGFFMLQRIQDTLSSVKLDPHDYGSSAASYYDNQSLGYGPNDHHHHLFTQPSGQKFTSAQKAEPRSSNYSDRGTYTTQPKPRNSSQLPLGLSEPGWTPNLSIHRAPVTRTGRPHTFALPPPPPPSVGAYDRPRSLEPERPAWEGSLRSSMNPHLTDMHIDVQPHSGGAAPQQTQIAHFSPSQSPGGRHGSPWANDSLGPGPRGVNLQYNSPLALYSKAAAQETLHGQQFGNAQVRSESDVYSLVHENDRRRSGNAPRNSQTSGGAYNHDAFESSFTDF